MGHGVGVPGHGVGVPGHGVGVPGHGVGVPAGRCSITSVSPPSTMLYLVLAHYLGSSLRLRPPVTATPPDPELASDRGPGRKRLCSSQQQPTSWPWPGDGVMRRPPWRLVLLCLACGFCSLLYAITQRGSGSTEVQEPAATSSVWWRGAADERLSYTLLKKQELDLGPMHLAVVACGDRLEETVTMLKSAVLFSIKPLEFHIFAEDQLHKDFSTILNTWGFPERFKYTLYPISFPSENAAEWRKLFKPCASQRLFLPLILKDVDSLLYVDTDILFLRPVDDIWSFLHEFNTTQIAAMAPEHEEPRIGWYNRFARHPFYGKTGINSGVMLMNMTRMRRKHFKNDMTTVRLHWGEILMPLLKKYKLNITWGDQDLLNIIFSHNPESLYVFPCQWNYRPDHCIYGSNCNEAEDGIFILHGNRGVYHDNKQPAFRAVYEALRNFSFGDDLIHSLLHPLELELQKTEHTYCGRIHKLFTKQLTKSIDDFSTRQLNVR